MLTQTRSQLFPPSATAPAAQRERSVEPAFAAQIPNYPNPSSAYQAALQASWEIDLWGRIRRQSEAAYANVLATDEARRGVILSLVASVANSYLQLRGLDAQLDVAKQTLQTYKESVDLFDAAVPVRPGVADERGAGAVAVRDGGGADPADRIADRADAELAGGADRPRPRADRARQVDRRPGAAAGAGRPAVGSCSSAAPTCCRPSSS